MLVIQIGLRKCIATHRQDQNLWPDVSYIKLRRCIATHILDENSWPDISYLNETYCLYNIPSIKNSQKIFVEGLNILTDVSLEFAQSAHHQLPFSTIPTY